MNEERKSADGSDESQTAGVVDGDEDALVANHEAGRLEANEPTTDQLGRLLAGSELTAVLIDIELRIELVTPKAADILDVGSNAIGLGVEQLEADALGKGVSHEVRGLLSGRAAAPPQLISKGARWFRRQARSVRAGKEVAGLVVSFTDVTELVSRHQGVALRTQRLELAWEAARGGIYEHSVAADAATYQSEHFARLLGYPPEAIPKSGEFPAWLSRLVHPEDSERVARAYQEFVSGRSEQYKTEARLLHGQGHWIWVRSISKALEQNEDNSVRRSIGIMLDITDLKQTEEALRESEARFREMTNGLPLMVWVHEASGDQQMVNDTFCEFFGVTHEQMKGRVWETLVHPDDAPSYLSRFYESLRGQLAFHGEARFQRADGEWRWLESWGRPRFTRTGEFRGLVGISADISDRKAAEFAVWEGKERFRTLADNISQLAWMADGKGWIFWYNKRWFDYTGTDLAEMEGWGWQKVHHPDHVDRVVQKVSYCFATGTTWEDTFPLRSKEGEYRWFLSRAVPIRDAEGNVVRWFGTNTDVTEQLVAEQRLLEADRRKDDFLAMLGHELRNPLAAIRSATELLRLSQSGNERLERAVGVLNRQSTHMAKLVHGLLDVSRITRGKLQTEKQKMDLVSVLRDVCSDLSGEAEQKTVDLQLQVSADRVIVFGDPARLTQVFHNLVSNGIKFTDAGGTVRIVARVDETSALVQVQDTGIGFSPELQQQLFEPFRQGPQDLARKGGGLGLGLALAKGLVELHAGHIEAHSAGEGKGAMFEVRLPLSGGSLSPDKGPAASVTPLRILVIEDNRDSGSMMKELLELSGHDVTIRTHGVDGIQAALQRLPDAILCDLGLPEGMTGFDVARAIRMRPETRHLPLIAVSGYGRPEDKRLSLEAGFDLHLTKPVDVDELEQALSELRASRVADARR